MVLASAIITAWLGTDNSLNGAGCDPRVAYGHADCSRSL